MVDTFQKGKWYKIGMWRCKFLKLEGTKFCCTFGITPHDAYTSSCESYIDYSRHHYPELITDLTEIQKYLPDNHPDKFNKIIEIWN